MRWLNRDTWKTAIVMASILPFLFLFIGIPMPMVSVQGDVGEAATPTPTLVQATPTVDATAVTQDKLKQEDEQLQRENSFPWIILNAVGSSIGTILVAAAALIAAW